jgi:hypothetical protein
MPVSFEKKTMKGWNCGADNNRMCAICCMFDVAANIRHGVAFEKTMTVLKLTNKELSEAVKIWQSLRPHAENWDNIVTDGRLVARTALRHLK